MFSLRLLSHTVEDHNCYISTLKVVGRYKRKIATSKACLRNVLKVPLERRLNEGKEWIQRVPIT